MDSPYHHGSDVPSSGPPSSIEGSIYSPRTHGSETSCVSPLTTSQIENISEPSSPMAYSDTTYSQTTHTSHTTPLTGISGLDDNNNATDFNNNDYSSFANSPMSPHANYNDCPKTPQTPGAAPRYVHYEDVSTTPRGPHGYDIGSTMDQALQPTMLDKVIFNHDSSSSADSDSIAPTQISVSRTERTEGSDRAKSVSYGHYSGTVDTYSQSGGQTPINREHHRELVAEQQAIEEEQKKHVNYQCAECYELNTFNLTENPCPNPRCRHCGYRIFYKLRTARMAVFDCR